MIKSKYKIARKLGPQVFDKTQTQKYALRAARRKPVMRKNSRPKTDFGLQLLEKQKAKMTYGLRERQFATYIKTISEKKVPNTSEKLMELLERRLDNVVYRLGLTNSRQFSRQVVSHGHILVNGKPVNIPSYTVKAGDVVEVKEISKKLIVIKDALKEVTKSGTYPWISLDADALKGTFVSVPRRADVVDLADVKEQLIVELYSK
ncbi:MAG: 30S ribosomal protein S4 [bacterium]